MIQFFVGLLVGAGMAVVVIALVAIGGDEDDSR